VKLNEIKEIIKMLEDSDIAEFILENEGVKLTLRKKVAFSPLPVGGQSISPPTSSPVSLSLPEVPLLTPVTSTDAEDTITIVAPMVGTFYRSPAPDAAPYVNVGDIVEVGQPLCIIEAMKLMNEIESEANGRVVRILVENAQPVEYGQPLFVIEPA
jgi:oxaloacetate decarboxylase alpha subunit